MSKKGAAQQLQTEINNDEDLLKFLTKDGLLLLEVYTGWCGPCGAMLSALKKIKLEKGGDDLILSVVKADDIETFSRFRNKSEPTWLLASSGKLVNGMFGTNVPELMKLIGNEIDLEKLYRAGEASRTFYELTEMIPFELVRFNAQKELDERNAKIDLEASVQKRIDYITSVTDEISERLVDMGVTVLMPHTINKDTLKRLPEYAEKFGLSAKDKRMVRIEEKDLEWLHFKIDNPLPDFVLNQLFEKDVYMVAWRIAETELQPAEIILRQLNDYLCIPEVIQHDIETNVYMPPVLKWTSILVNDIEYEKYLAEQTLDDAAAIEIYDEFNMRREVSVEMNNKETNIPSESPPGTGEKADAITEKNGKENTNPVEEGGHTDEQAVVEESEPINAVVDGETTEHPDESPENETQEGIEKSQDEKGPDEAEAADASHDDVDVPDPQDVLEGDVILEVPPTDAAPPQSQEILEIVDGIDAEAIATNKVNIMPAWTPANKTANSALIYLYFRVLTDHFLAPDPQPDPPHVAVVFDAHRRFDIMNHIELNKENVLAYGYFTNDKPDKTELLANSTYKYEKMKTKTITDCMVLKVSKKTSNTLLTLVGQGPCYISLNTREGEKECKQFFPEGYETGNEGPEEDEEEEVEGDEVDDEGGEKAADEGETNDEEPATEGEVEGEKIVSDVNPEIVATSDAADGASTKE